nr:hypothetical protein [Escherichia coli]
MNALQRVAGGTAPYIAEIIKQTTPDGAGRVAAHAVVNAALSLAQGKNALAGAAGAATGKMVGMIATEMCGISPGTVTCKRYITKLHPSLYERIYISFADKIEINSANEEE